MRPADESTTTFRSHKNLRIAVAGELFPVHVQCWWLSTRNNTVLVRLLLTASSRPVWECAVLLEGCTLPL